MASSHTTSHWVEQLSYPPAALHSATVYLSQFLSDSLHLILSVPYCPVGSFQQLWLILILLTAKKVSYQSVRCTSLSHLQKEKLNLHSILILIPANQASYQSIRCTTLSQLQKEKLQSVSTTGVWKAAKSSDSNSSAEKGFTYQVLKIHIIITVIIVIVVVVIRTLWPSSN